MFAKYHYLSHGHNNAATVYLAYVNGQLAGFLSVLHFPHPKAKNIKKVHRLVVLPDYQGAGIGIKFLEIVGEIYKKNGWRYTIVTSSPSLVFALKKSNRWACSSFGRKSTQSKGSTVGNMKISQDRITVSWEFKG